MTIPERIKTAAGRSGKPLEVACAQEFLAITGIAGGPRPWNVNVSSYYEDVLGARENPVRELDVLARREASITLKSNQIHLRLDVLLSCKGFPEDKQPVTFSINREAVPETEKPLLLSSIALPGSNRELGTNAAQLLLYELGLQRDAEPLKARRIVGFGIFKDSKDPNQEWTGEGDKALFEGMDSAFRASLFWWSRSWRSLAVRLFVPVLVVSKIWHDIPIDNGAIGVGGGEKTGQLRRPETGRRRLKGGVEHPPAGTLGVEVPRTSTAML